MSALEQTTAKKTSRKHGGSEAGLRKRRQKRFAEKRDDEGSQGVAPAGLLVGDDSGCLCACEAAEQLDFNSLLGYPRISIGRRAYSALCDRVSVHDLGDEPGFEGWIEPDGIVCSHSAPGGFLFQGDAIRFLRSLPDDCVDLAFADPPYGIGKADWDVFAGENEYLDWCDEWIGELSRVLSPTGSCYICGFSEILADVKARTKRHFKACRWLVWNYRNKANLGCDWGRSHESILHFRKTPTTALNVNDIRIPYGAHTLKYPARTQAETSAFAKSAPPKGGAWFPNPLGAKPKDVFDIPTTCNGMGEKTPHPTQKPEELLRKLVLASSRPGDWVLDPFSGSGTTLVAAEQLGRRWLGCDLSEEYNGWAVKRLRAVKPKSVAEWIAFDRETATRRGSIR